jgi:hypothetical protein
MSTVAYMTTVAHVSTSGRKLLAPDRRSSVFPALLVECPRNKWAGARREAPLGKAAAAMIGCPALRQAATKSIRRIAGTGPSGGAGRGKRRLQESSQLRGRPRKTMVCPTARRDWPVVVQRGIAATKSAGMSPGVAD